LLLGAAPVPVVSTRSEPILVEGVAFDARGRLLVSAVRAGGVFRVASNGALVRWSQPPTSARKGFFGIAADPARNALWAATSCSAYADCPTTNLPSLVRMNRRTGRVEQIVNGRDRAQTFGDVAVGPDGTIFVSDSGAGEVLRLMPGASELERVIKLEGRASPQGLVVSDDGRTLVFSNYGDGLHRIDLATGAHTRVLDDEGKGPRGIDGVARSGNDLILVHNATQPARVLRVTLNADWTAIVAAEQLAEGAPMAEPTGGVVRNGEFVFVSRSQWTDFDAEGKPKPDLGPAIVSRLRLPARTPSGG
jgi:sugar lactone lactonase YvrE